MHVTRDFLQRQAAERQKQGKVYRRSASERDKKIERYEKKCKSHNNTRKQGLQGHLKNEQWRDKIARNHEIGQQHKLRDDPDDARRNQPKVGHEEHIAEDGQYAGDDISYK